MRHSGKWSAYRSRRIVERIVVEGELELRTPAHFGAGDTDGIVDMPLLLDPVSGNQPLLPGASITGALRAYLGARDQGYGKKTVAGSLTEMLFGVSRARQDGGQSALIVDDALGRIVGTERRDGVRLNGTSRTAEHDKLFDTLFWGAGTRFPLRFELALAEPSSAVDRTSEKIKRAFAIALSGFGSLQRDGDITLGARKRRGFGRVRALGWRIKSYNLAQSDGLLDWIENGMRPLGSEIDFHGDIGQALGLTEPLNDDQRVFFKMTATFGLQGSLLIRSYDPSGAGPDMFHLRTRQVDGRVQPIVSGTSLGGALRARAMRIANGLGPDKAQGIVEDIFGPKTIERGRLNRSSRLTVSEQTITGAESELVQNRVSIDRFTGGALDAALFDQQPVFGADNSQMTVELHLRNPQSQEIGLLLLLLKDLWTGDLALGGESSVGRGRLAGRVVNLEYRRAPGEEPHIWKITETTERLSVEGDRDHLEGFVSVCLLNYLSDKAEDGSQGGKA